ncbi:MAG: hypothetical protein R3272_16995 [Candidatus Promineifilaceae bacterium]|nr:hypothetical protein [Candidatus Promineifilaceae bacterium]
MTDLLLTIATHSLWIGGLALALAVLSYGYFQAQEEERALRSLLLHPAYVTFLWLSAILVGLGLVATAETVLEGVVWLLLSLFSLFNLYGSAREWRQWPDETEHKPVDGDG